MASPLRIPKFASLNRKKLASLLRGDSRKSQKSAKKSPHRLGQVEQLEDRRLLNADYRPDYGGTYPAIGIQTGDFVDIGAMQEYIRRSQGPYGSGYGNPNYGNSSPTAAEGLSQPVVVTEQEPNNSALAPQMITLNSSTPESSIALILGALRNTTNRADIDHYGMNLRGGDILDLQLQASDAGAFSMEITDANGLRLVTALQPAGAGIYSSAPGVSPLSTEGLISFSYVIPTDGLYQLQITNGVGSYEVRAQLFRNPMEQEPIGAVQEIYLDFDGVLLDRSPWGIQGVAQIPSLLDTLTPYGYTAAEVNQLIDVILRRFKERMDLVFPPTNPSYNGQYDADGIPGNASYRLTNSRDHGERWGQPNVTRGIIGGSSFEFFGGGLIGILGIAEAIDIGNFNHEDQFIVMPENFVLLGLDNATVSPNSSQIEFFGNALSSTTVHEFGHIAGMFHTNTNQTPQGLMDVGANIKILYELGPDVIHGTADDQTLTFTNKQYVLSPAFPNIPGEFLLGRENQAASMTHALATGTRGATVRGNVFNDVNRNGTRQGGEFGIAGQIVFVDSNNNFVLDAGEPRATTGGDGSYVLRTPAGSFNVRTVAANSFVVTTAGVAVSVGMDGSVSNINLGQVLPNQTLTGFKWADLDGDGIRDEGEPGIPGVYIYADLDGDNRPDLAEPAAFTLIDGSYVLDAPASGTYSIREVLNPGFLQTFPTNEEREHVITPSTPRPLQGLNFGNQPARDYGDLPSPKYQTLAADNGPSHGFLPGLRLGTAFDIDPDGNPSNDARGDNITNVDDEDGVRLETPLVVGASNNQIRVTVTNDTGTTAFLQGWMDFDGNGIFSDAENIIPNRVAASGIYSFSIPAIANVGNVYARFRLSQTSGIGPNGPVTVGEVEDYRFQTLASLEYTRTDSFLVGRNSALADNVFDVLANDPIINVDGFSATIFGVTQGTRGGQVTTDGSTVRYRPAPGFVGTDIFQYTVQVSNNVFVQETVTVRVDFLFANPKAIDDSFDVSVNSPGIALDVLGNDVQGQNGSLIIPSQTITTSSGGTAVVSANGQRIIYTPALLFEGTETFSYRITDSSNINGTDQRAQVTIHVLPGDRDNDDVEISLIFRNLNGDEISRVVQGQSFLVDVMVTDLRPAPTAPAGVYAAYLDLLYNSDFVLPSPGTGNPFSYNVQFAPEFSMLRTGSDVFPGLIDEFGASRLLPTAVTGPVRMATIRFDARTTGIANFFPDPADLSPESDVILSNNPVAVPEIRTRYVRTAIEVIANVTQFPQAVDDSPNRVYTAGSSGNIIDVLVNDITGANGPIRIDGIVNQPSSGSVTIDRRGDNNPANDVLIFNAGATSGVEIFTYRIIDAAGFESYANVTVQVGNQTPDIRMRLDLTDTAGNPITQITVGSNFQLRGYVEDVRDPVQVEAGVYAAFQDILISNPNLVLVNTANNPRGFAVVFDPAYAVATSGDIRVPGVINEIGSQQTDDQNEMGLGEKLQFIITLTAIGSGTVTFVGDPADLIPISDSLFFDTVAPVDKSLIEYDDVTLTITNATGVAESEGLTNSSNPLDANNDGNVTALDLLTVVNEIVAKNRRQLFSRTGGEGEGEASPLLTATTRRVYPDINGDGLISGLDLLSLVNHLAERSRTSGRGEGESSSASSVTDSALSSGIENSALDSAIDAFAMDVDSAKKSGTRI